MLPSSLIGLLDRTMAFQLNTAAAMWLKLNETDAAEMMMKAMAAGGANSVARGDNVEHIVEHVYPGEMGENFEIGR